MSDLAVTHGYIPEQIQKFTAPAKRCFWMKY